MTQQPEALRLADAILCGAEPDYIQVEKAAAELRRLHEENERLKRTLAASCDEEREQLWEAGPGGGCIRALDAEARIAALEQAGRQALEALEVLDRVVLGTRRAEEAITALRQALGDK